MLLFGGRQAGGSFAQLLAFTLIVLIVVDHASGFWLIRRRRSTRRRRSVPACTAVCQNGGTCSGSSCACPSGFTGSACQTPVCPTGCRVRKEINDMTQAERLRFITAYKTAYSRNDFRTLILSHRDNFNGGIHNSAHFLPWHRWFILQVENVLKKVDCHVTMPYWDWSLVSGDPWSAPVWSDAPHFFGGNGHNACISTGPFSSGQFTPISGGCLRRNFLGSPPSVPDVRRVLDDSPSVVLFMINIETSLNSRVYCNIGGTMCSNTAAQAPEFFLHHTFIDKLWSDWQGKSSAHALDFPPGQLHKNMPATSPVEVTPYHVINLSTQPGGVCVRYQQPQSEIARRLAAALKVVPQFWLPTHLPCDQPLHGTVDAIKQSRALLHTTIKYKFVQSNFERGLSCKMPTPGEEKPSIGSALGFNLLTLERLAKQQ